MYGIAHALEYLHSFNIVHRDINLENILLDANLWPAICDFGLAQNASEPILDSSMGNAVYMPKEFLENRVFDKPCDVYSYGVLAYETLSGELVSVSLNSRTLDDIFPSFGKIEEPYRTLLKNCIFRDSRNRPTFSEIVREFRENKSYVTKDINADEFYRFVKFIDNEIHLI